MSSTPLRVCGFRHLIIFIRPLLRGRGPRYTDETRYISGAIPTSAYVTRRQTGLFLGRGFQHDTRRNRGKEITGKEHFAKREGHVGYLTHTGFSGISRRNYESRPTGKYTQIHSAADLYVSFLD